MPKIPHVYYDKASSSYFASSDWVYPLFFLNSFNLSENMLILNPF